MQEQLPRVGQGLFLQSDSIPAIHGGQVWTRSAGTKPPLQPISGTPVSTEILIGEPYTLLQGRLVPPPQGVHRRYVQELARRAVGAAAIPDHVALESDDFFHHVH